MGANDRRRALVSETERDYAGGLTCPFCDRITAGDVTAERASAVAFPDAFPVSEGHTLVVPRRHEPALVGLTPREQSELWELALATARGAPACDGINIGLNLGEAAGQTVDHVHIHVIPRYRGDVEDPRGGVRWVLPQKAPYWGDA